MQNNRVILDDALETCEEKVKSLNSYVRELKATTAKHETPTEHYESDLAKAMHDILHYEDTIKLLKNQRRTPSSPGLKSGPVGTLLPKTRNQGIGAVILSSISFAAGTIVGSLLNSGKSNKDRESGS